MSHLQLQGESGSRDIPGDFLLVAIDETGHEFPTRTAHPVFGLGGCAVQVSHYAKAIHAPWQALKKAHFGGAIAPLHASELRNPTPAQLAALAEFFNAGSFGRLAAVLSVNTTLPPSISPYQIAARELHGQIAHLVKRLECSGACIIFEESQRADHLAKEFFSGYDFIARTVSGQQRKLESHFGRMPKSAGEPFLEVADFVIHAAGGQVRASVAGSEWGQRKDFRAVFGIPDQSLVRFMEILSAELNSGAARSE